MRLVSIDLQATQGQRDTQDLCPLASYCSLSYVLAETLSERGIMEKATGLAPVEEGGREGVNDGRHCAPPSHIIGVCLHSG